MSITNVNEKFLLALLETTDSVYYSTNNRNESDYFYFYPQDLGLTIQIPVFNSNHVNINFVYDRTDPRDKKIFNLSINAFHEIEGFMGELYKKYSNMLNGSALGSNCHILCEKWESSLKLPMEKYNGIYEGDNETLKIISKDDSGTMRIILGQELFKYDLPIPFRPLEPIKLLCIHYNISTDESNTFNIVIPAYRVNEFPAISAVAHTTMTTDDIHLLADRLRHILPESSSRLNAILLETELDKPIEPKKIETKFKLYYAILFFFLH